MQAAGLRSQVGYRRPRHRSGPVSVHAPNRLQQQFTVARPNDAWLSDITHIRTHNGWLYLAVILDLFSRRVIGWSLQARIKKERVLDALLMAVWRRKPTSTVTVHTDQGSQYTSHDWQNFLKSHNLHIYAARDDARADVVDYIEMFYNSKRRHGFNDLLSPVEYEKKFTERLVSV